MKDISQDQLNNYLIWLKQQGQRWPRGSIQASDEISIESEPFNFLIYHEEALTPETSTMKDKLQVAMHLEKHNSLWIDLADVRQIEKPQKALIIFGRKLASKLLGSIVETPSLKTWQGCSLY